MFRPAIILAAILTGVLVSLMVVGVIVLIGRDPIRIGDLEEIACGGFERQRWHHHAPETWQEFTPLVMDYHWTGGRFVTVFRMKNAVQTDDYSSPEFASQLAKQEAYSINIEQVGWPFFCAYKEKWSQTLGRNLVDSGENILVIGKQRFPKRVMWFGLFGNTLIYGVFAWVIMMLLSLARRWNRLRLCRCPKCAYHLHDRIADGCPECGWNRPDAGEAESDPAR